MYALTYLLTQWLISKMKTIVNKADSVNTGILRYRSMAGPWELLKKEICQMCYKLIKIVQSRGVHNIPFKIRSIIHNNFLLKITMCFCLWNQFTAKLLKLKINLPFKVTFANKIFRCHNGYVLSWVATLIKWSRNGYCQRS